MCWAQDLSALHISAISWMNRKDGNRSCPPGKTLRHTAKVLPCFLFRISAFVCREIMHGDSVWVYLVGKWSVIGISAIRQALITRNRALFCVPPGGCYRIVWIGCFNLLQNRRLVR